MANKVARVDYKITLAQNATKDQLRKILSPSKTDEGVWIHQNAWFHLGDLECGQSLQHQLKDPINNGIYAFLISGKLSINGQELDARDGYGLWEIDGLDIQVAEDAKLLLMEVPMQLE